MISQQDRRSLLAVMLCFVVYMVWMALFPPPPPVVEEGALTEEGAAQEGQVAEGTEVEPVQPVAPVAPVNVPTSERVDAHGQDLAPDGWVAEVHSANGALRSLNLTEYEKAAVTTPIWQWGLAKVMGDEDPGSWSPYAFSEEPLHLLGEEGALVLVGTGNLDDDGAGIPGADSAYAIEQEGSTVVARRQRSDGLVIQKTYTPSAQQYLLDVEVTLQNSSSTALGAPWFGVADRMSGEAGRFANAPRPLVEVDEDIEHLYDLEDVEGEEVEVYDDGPVNWFGVGDRYFMAVLVPQDGAADGAHVVVDQLPGGRFGSFMMGGEALQPGETRVVRFSAYVGPKRLDLLEEYGMSLDDAVEYGWFGFFSRILLFFLKLCHSLVGNWGVAILMLTLLVKGAFFPLTQKAYSSSKRMQAIQPKLAEVKEQYKDNRELQTQKTMELFKENGVNPMGGCLPTLIQMPVWFALYNVMLYSVELFDSSFLYLQDLTAADPYGVLPAMYAIVMVVQQRMMPMGSMDPQQQKIIKMMPLIFSFFMFSFPSGLVLYFSVNMMLTVIQQLLINRQFKSGPPPAASAAAS